MTAQVSQRVDYEASQLSLSAVSLAADAPASPAPVEFPSTSFLRAIRLLTLRQSRFSGLSTHVDLRDVYNKGQYAPWNSTARLSRQSLQIPAEVSFVAGSVHLAGVRRRSSCLDPFRAPHLPPPGGEWADSDFREFRPPFGEIRLRFRICSWICTYSPNRDVTEWLSDSHCSCRASSLLRGG